MGDITVKEIDYETFGRCVELCNGKISLVATLDFGPRIIRFGFTDEENELCDNSPIAVKSGYGEWRMFGGHRLTHSPENVPRTYMPDDKPVEYIPVSNGIRLTQESETWTQIRKEMEITFEAGKNSVNILQRLTNNNAWPVELAVWGITVMAQGGREIIPLAQKDTGSLPNRSLVLWPYSDIKDRRFHLLDRYILLEQDPEAEEAFKIGINNENGWVAYLNHNNLFVKRCEYAAGKNYPDFGVSYETYVNDAVLEMEFLSPIEKMDINESLTLVETWELIKNVALEDESLHSIDKLVESYIVKSE